MIRIEDRLIQWTKSFDQIKFPFLSSQFIRAIRVLISTAQLVWRTRLHVILVVNLIFFDILSAFDIRVHLSSMVLIAHRLSRNMRDLVLVVNDAVGTYLYYFTFFSSCLAFSYREIQQPCELIISCSRLSKRVEDHSEGDRDLCVD